MTKLGAILAAGAVALVLAVASPAGAQVPPEVCGALDTVAAQADTAQGTVEGAAGQSLPANLASQIRTAKSTLGCPSSGGGGDFESDSGASQGGDKSAAGRGATTSVGAAEGGSTLPRTGGPASPLPAAAAVAALAGAGGLVALRRRFG